ncbi:MAG: CoA-binding protein [Candidatus Woesearchaeota archaeon]
MNQQYWNKTYTYAVVGASPNPEKYGNTVLSTLMQKGYHVLPINPNEKTILGIQCYPRLLDCPNPIDVVIFVVPPHVTLNVLKDVLKKGISKVWFQPGSESQEALEFCKRNGILATAHACMFQHLNRS